MISVNQTPPVSEIVEGEEASSAAAGRAAWSAAVLALSACGGGSGDSPSGEVVTVGSSDSAGAAGQTPVAATPAAERVTETQAARFLAQASLGVSRANIKRVQALGYVGWLEEQTTLPTDTTRWDWLIAKGLDAPENRDNLSGFDPVIWRKLLASPDTLRQRMSLALSEILVVGVDGLTQSWRQFCAAHWLDTLEAHALGNLRSLLGVASRHVAMGLYLSFRGNAKANPSTGSLPDENYARELMQLFMIGLQELNEDGSLRLVNGQARETYTQEDIAGLARVFTGWDRDLSVSDTSTPQYHRRPMIQVASRYETGAKSFLGLTIPAGTPAEEAMSRALDHLYAHPNVPPFWSRQLIQRLVTSNPSPGYVQRVARVFADDGTGQRGNLKAVLLAVLLDSEARGEAGLTDPHFGKLREPVLRLVGWARAMGARSPSDAWAIGNTSDAATRLGQSPLRSPSVFNFFRPGYVPPNSAVANAGLVAPEFQITHESSVVGYLNYMQTTISNGRGDVKADYTELLALANNPEALVAEVDLLLAAGQLSEGTRQTIRQALSDMSASTDAQRLARAHAAVLLVMATPEYLIQK